MYITLLISDICPVLVNSKLLPLLTLFSMREHSFQDLVLLSKFHDFLLKCFHLPIWCHFLLLINHLCLKKQHCSEHKKIIPTHFTRWQNMKMLKQINNRVLCKCNCYEFSGLHSFSKFCIFLFKSFFSSCSAIRQSFKSRISELSVMPWWAKETNFQPIKIYYNLVLIKIDSSKGKL